jgi:hypothetical protein
LLLVLFFFIAEGAVREDVFLLAEGGAARIGSRLAGLDII